MTVAPPAKTKTKRRLGRRDLVEVKSAVASPDDVLVMYAAYSLNRLGVHDWVLLTAGRLSNMNSDRTVRGNFAAAMAGAGDYSGWSVVRNEIVNNRSNETGFGQAMVWASAFENMPGPFGPRLTLSHELHELLPQLPGSRQAMVQREITRVQSAVAPRPKPQ